MSDVWSHFLDRVRETLFPAMQEHGFDDFDTTTAWRHSDRWIDTLELQPQQDGVVSGAASFYVVVGTYYLDVNRLPWAAPAPHHPRFENVLPKGLGMCQRQMYLARSNRDRNLDGRYFWIEDEGGNLEETLADVMNAFLTRGLDWIEGTHDIRSYLTRLQTVTQGGAWTWKVLVEDMLVTDEEWAEYREWERRNFEIGGENYGTYQPTEDYPPLVQARIDAVAEEQRFQDSTMADTEYPAGDLMYGLELGEGRIWRIIQTKRHLIEAYTRDLRGREPNEAVAAIIKREAEHIQMLERL